SHDLSFQIASLPLGGGVPPRCIRESIPIVKKHRTDHARLMARRALSTVFAGSGSASGNSAARLTSRAARRRLATFSALRASARTKYSWPTRIKIG
ncbi:MAG: hypothetical protein KGK16_13480, partial [Bradyrhizobium sp.]|nr:hypothetical protein [Bradyrhizobium sp.]